MKSCCGPGTKNCNPSKKQIGFYLREDRRGFQNLCGLAELGSVDISAEPNQSTNET